MFCQNLIKLLTNNDEKVRLNFRLLKKIMRLYSGNTQQFIQDNVLNQIAEKLKQSFFDYFRHNPSQNEIRSWQNSLKSLSLTLQYSNLLDHGIILEYQLPLTSKHLDCLLTGQDNETKKNAVIIELKQWENSES